MQKVSFPSFGCSRSPSCGPAGPDIGFAACFTVIRQCFCSVQPTQPLNILDDFEVRGPAIPMLTRERLTHWALRSGFIGRASLAGKITEVTLPTNQLSTLAARIAQYSRIRSTAQSCRMTSLWHGKAFKANKSLRGSSQALICSSYIVATNTRKAPAVETISFKYLLLRIDEAAERWQGRYMPNLRN